MSIAITMRSKLKIYLIADSCCKNAKSKHFDSEFTANLGLKMNVNDFIAFWSRR